MLFTFAIGNISTAYALTKASSSRAIAIVFDNSGSMYINDDNSPNKAWCRATYAMEVFASMLNAGDILQIYPMHPITVAGKEYTMNNPLQINSAQQAATIRDIYTPKASGTPMESIDAATKGLKEVTADKKYLIVLTDGDAFSGYSKNNAKKELDSRFQKQINDGTTVMYLGIGSNVIMPDTQNSDSFVKEKAENSENVLSSLTEMCNLIFGRDTLPKNHISGKTVEFDISMSKLIIFAQGSNISNLKIKGPSGLVGEQVSSSSTKYGTKGCGNYDSVADESLQGMMVTYKDCPAGTYTIEYSGTVTNIEIYYEPDADLDFVFTDADGNDVDPNALYEGDYKVSFGMKDAKTGELISSDLLGDTHYDGAYFVNEIEHPIVHDGESGEVLVSLNMNDTFAAELTATYLSGYKIKKDSSDFGWPDLGIQVAARPAGDLRLEISGGDRIYSLEDLKSGTPYTAKVYYKGTQLVGDALKSVELKWDSSTSNAEITQEFADDHYNLYLDYKDPSAPQDTVCGKCKVTIYAFYSEKGSDVAEARASLTYNINGDLSDFKMNLYAPQDYIVIKEIDDSKEIVVELTKDGEKLSAEDFKSVTLQVDCGNIAHTVTPCEEDSTYLIKLTSTDNIQEGTYPIKVEAQYKDHIGRTTQVNDEVDVTLSNTPLWLKWLIRLAILLLVLIIIWIILHIKVLPKKIKPMDCNMNFYGDDVTNDTTFTVKLNGSQMLVRSQYAGTNVDIVMNVKPGKESYLYKSQKRRSIEVVSGSVKKAGIATISNADIGAVSYRYDEDRDNIIRDPENNNNFVLRNANEISFSGAMPDASGRDRDFSTSIKLKFTK